VPSETKEQRAKVRTTRLKDTSMPSYKYAVRKYNVRGEVGVKQQNSALAEEWNNCNVLPREMSTND